MAVAASAVAFFLVIFLSMPRAATSPMGLAILKQPRVGSTWVKKELNSLPGVHLEFEPLTDGTHRCPSNFTNTVLAQLMREPPCA